MSINYNRINRLELIAAVGILISSCHAENGHETHSNGRLRAAFHYTRVVKTLEDRPRRRPAHVQVPTHRRPCPSSAEGGQTVLHHVQHPRIDRAPNLSVP